MKFHPLADLFPLLPDEELGDLALDIKNNGLLGKITTLEGKILDGRNRWLACKRAGVEPKLSEFKGADPLSFVISANLRRRHLNESQRALIAAKISEAPTGDQSSVPIGTLTREKAAKMLNVGVRSVSRAKKVLKEASGKDIKAVESGKESVSAVIDELAKKKKLSTVEDVFDQTGYAVPAPALEFWHRSDEAKEILSLISKARAAVRAIDSNDKMYAEVNVNGVLSRLNAAFNEFNPAVPYAVCTTCQGVAINTCTFCKGRGVISKFRFDTCAPEELKAIRLKGKKK